MRRFTRLLGICVVVPTIVAVSGLPAHAGGYPLKCDKNTVYVGLYDAPGEFSDPITGPGAIQAGVDAARGEPAGSSVGDTVLVCPGTFTENVQVGVADDPETEDVNEADAKANVSIRTWGGTDQTTVVAADPSLPVFDIDAHGVVLGGPGVGFTITGSDTGIQVGNPGPPDMTEDDDQEITECDIVSGECPDEELAPLGPINVTVMGNKVKELSSATDDVIGISVDNSNNTMVFRNLIERLSAGTDATAYGIHYGGTNANVEILENAVKHIVQTGTSDACAGASLDTPSTGAVGISVAEEALDALAFENLVEDITSTCVGIGIYSDAWGGLENDRNGQQIPIVTDVVDNRIKKIKGAASTLDETTATFNSAGVVLAPHPMPTEDEEDDPHPPSSFRVMVNDIDDAQVAVAVLQQLAPYSYIEENDFDHDEVGVLNGGNSNLDATNNWWGCQEGPLAIDVDGESAERLPGAVLSVAMGQDSCATIVNTMYLEDPTDPDSAVLGTTFFNPWLKHHVDHAGEHAGEHAGHG